MEHEASHVLLIEDNPGDADLVRLRLVESKPDVYVNCVPRLSDALVCLEAQTPSLVLLDSEPSRQPRRGNLSADQGEGSERAGRDPFGSGR